MLSETQLFLVFIGVILLVNLLVALIDWRWGRGIAFTALVLLALAFSVFISVVFLQAVRQSLDKELADPQSWASLGVGLGTAFWAIIEVPVVLGLGIGAMLLAALSRQRGWIIANTIALLCAIAAPLLALKITRDISASKDIFNPLSVHEADVRLVQAHVALEVVLLALQLLYLAYGAWRIWHSVRLGRRSVAVMPLPSAQS
jgi:hypothetical protein